jgi:SAM-dependent methyltransferase
MMLNVSPKGDHDTTLRAGHSKERRARRSQHVVYHQDSLVFVFFQQSVNGFAPRTRRSRITTCGRNGRLHSRQARKLAHYQFASAVCGGKGYFGDAMSRIDRSNGYEAIAAEFLARCGRPSQTAVGVREVREWARTLPTGATVIDLGCGPGLPITDVLVAEDLCVFALDAAPSFVQAFRRNLPDTPIVCEGVQDSTFFGRRFDAVLAWGLMFLLSSEDQQRLIRSIADILVPGGRLLFTSPFQPAVWNDGMTGLESRSLGAEEYHKQLSLVGLSVAREYEDVGENHYFDAIKTRL